MSSKDRTSSAAPIAGGEDSIPLLLRDARDRYRGHDDGGRDAEDDEEMLPGVTERLNSPPPYLKLDPTSSSLAVSRQIWRARLLRLVLIASCLILGLVGGAVLEHLGHVVPSSAGGYANITTATTEHSSLILNESGDSTTESAKAGDDILRWVKSTSADSFRDNMQPGVQYLTTWNSAGMTNNFMGYVNMIYLSLLTSRVAVLPPLVPSTLHLGQGDHKIPFVSFSNAFDLPRLRDSLHGHPVINWRDLKRARYDEPWNRQSPPLEGVVRTEELGCWSVNRPYQRDLERLMELDVSYTMVPTSTRLSRPGAWQRSFPGLASLLFAKGRDDALTALPADLRHPSPNSKATLAPDEALACVDDMYAVGSWYEYEWEFELSPAWRHVGRYVRFNGTVDALAEAYVKRVLGVEEGGAMPDYIAIHIRRDDWDSHCFEKYPDRECFAPLSEFAKKIEEVRQDLRNITTTTRSTNPRRRHDTNTDTQSTDDTQGQPADLLPVIVTSDEKNQTWYTSDVAAMGWRYVDHRREGTADRLGRWWPALIDAAVLSRARGMVGVRRSTMSLVAALRVRDWNGGPTRMVDWYDGHGKGGGRRHSARAGDDFTTPVQGRDEWYN